MDSTESQPYNTVWKDDCPCCKYPKLDAAEYECPCCKLTPEGGRSILNTKAKEYSEEMADKLTYHYAHESALEDAKKQCPERGTFRTEYYMMMYRIHYKTIRGQILPLCHLRYMLHVHTLFNGDLKKSCSKFRESHKKYKEKGKAAFDGSDDNYEFYSPFSPEMRKIVDEYYETNPIATS